MNARWLRANTVRVGALGLLASISALHVHQRAQGKRGTERILFAIVSSWRVDAVFFLTLHWRRRGSFFLA